MEAHLKIIFSELVTNLKHRGNLYKQKSAYKRRTDTDEKDGVHILAPLEVDLYISSISATNKSFKSHGLKTNDSRCYLTHSWC